MCVLCVMSTFKNHIFPSQCHIFYEQPADWVTETTSQRVCIKTVITGSSHPELNDSSGCEAATQDAKRSSLLVCMALLCVNSCLQQEQLNCLFSGASEY